MERLFTNAFLSELKMETPSTRKCLERISESVFDYKPHPTSMQMGYLASLVAEIPLWIHHMIEDPEIDFVTYPHAKIETNEQLVTHFEDNIRKAEMSLQNATDESLQKMFSLKADGKVMYTSSKKENIENTLNHWVHHRGQLTVYMRMKEIPVPSIYGPSADDKIF